MTHVCTYSHTVLILHAQHIRTNSDASEHTHKYTHTHTWLYKHIHTLSIMEAKKTIYNMLVSPQTQCSQLLLTSHTIIKKTMVRQASCCVFGSVLTISQLADQDTKAVIFRAGLLCITTKDSMMASDKTASEANLVFSNSRCN